MDFFQYTSGEAHAEDVPLAALAAQLGTPLYVYSKATLERHLTELKRALGDFPALPCFAVKANSNLAVLRLIFSHGYGADVVSGGEMERALVAGVAPAHIVFSGVGKKEEEISRALEVGILSFNVESPEELRSIARIAGALGKKARISLRINPNIDAKTHPHITTGMYTTKFGMAEEAARACVSELGRHPHIQLVGLACHIGSQITELDPFRQAARRMAQFATDLRQEGYPIELIDLGGGLGIRYHDEEPPSLTDYASVIKEEVGPTGLKVVVEPGRVLVGNAGVLVTRVVTTKQTAQKKFIIVDAAMNDLIRPSLYEAYHEILPVKDRRDEPKQLVDVVGPVCESGDYLGKERELPAVQSGDLLFLRSAGAYGMTMASNYNTRPRAAEVLVDGNRYHLVRERESLEGLWASEKRLLAEIP